MPDSAWETHNMSCSQFNCCLIFIQTTHSYMSGIHLFSTAGFVEPELAYEYIKFRRGVWQQATVENDQPRFFFTKSLNCIVNCAIPSRNCPNHCIINGEEKTKFHSTANVALIWRSLPSTFWPTMWEVAMSLRSILKNLNLKEIKRFIRKNTFLHKLKHQKIFNLHMPPNVRFCKIPFGY